MLRKAAYGLHVGHELIGDLLHLRSGVEALPERGEEELEQILLELLVVLVHDLIERADRLALHALERLVELELALEHTEVDIHARLVELLVGHLCERATWGLSCNPDSVCVCGVCVNLVGVMGVLSTAPAMGRR